MYKASFGKRCYISLTLIIMYCLIMSIVIWIDSFCLSGNNKFFFFFPYFTWSYSKFQFIYFLLNKAFHFIKLQLTKQLKSFFVISYLKYWIKLARGYKHKYANMHKYMHLYRTYACVHMYIWTKICINICNCAYVVTKIKYNYMWIHVCTYT